MNEAIQNANKTLKPCKMVSFVMVKGDTNGLVIGKYKVYFLTPRESSVILTWIRENSEQIVCPPVSGSVVEAEIQNNCGLGSLP